MDQGKNAPKYQEDENLIFMICENPSLPNLIHICIAMEYHHDPRPPQKHAVTRHKSPSSPRPGAESTGNVGFFFVVENCGIEPIWVYQKSSKFPWWLFILCFFIMWKTVKKPYTFVWILGFWDLFAPSKMAMFQPWIIFVTDCGRAEFVGNLLGAARPNSHVWGQPISQWQQLWMQHFHTLSIWTWYDMVPPFTQANIFDWQPHRHPAALY